MKNFSARALPIVLFIIIALITVGGIFSQYFNETLSSDTYLPRNYNENGTHSEITGTDNENGINLAEGDPTLLNHSEIYNIVIFICFSDETPSTEFPLSLTESIMDSFNGEWSMADYYRNLSYGKFSVNTVSPMKNTAYYVYKDTRTREYYEKITAESGTSRYNAESSLLNNAVASASDWLSLTSANLDANSDGYVDSVSFVVSGTYEQDAWGHLMWPHAWNLDKISSLSSSGSSSAALKGVKVNNYTFTFAKAFRIGLITHEFGHLVGLPDLYHYDDDTEYLPVGYWDLMHLDCVTPQFSLSYLRSKYLGFLDAKQTPEMTVGGTYTLTPTTLASEDEPVAYKITLSATESIWMEYRYASSATYDRDLPSSGLIVYRVNNSVYGNTEGRYQDRYHPDEVYVYRPNAAPTSVSGTKSRETYNLARAALNTSADGISVLGNASSTAKYSQSCIYLTDGSNTGIVITVNEQSDEKITFTVDLGKYDCTYIGDSYVVGTDKNGNAVKNEHYAYYGEDLNIKVYLKYSTRPAAIELTDFRIEYENKVCPEGQVAYVIFNDSSGERKIPFTLYIYDVLRLEATVVDRPSVTVIKAGGTLDLSGLSIAVNYLSGKTEIVRYNDTDPSEWVISEGLDTSVHGRYDHVLIVFREKIYFTLSGVIVQSNITSMRVEEINTRHLSGDCFDASFNVIGTFADGTERALDTSEYTVNYASDTPFDKTVVTVTSNENRDIHAESYVILTSSAAVNSVREISPPEKTVFEYGEEPSFTGGEIEIVFDNGNSVRLKTENYTAELLKSFSYTKSGTQKLTCGLGYKTGYGGASYTLSITVLPVSSSILTVKSDSQFSGNISVNDKKSEIVINSPMTLGDLASSLVSRLELSFTDTEGKFNMPLSAFSSRKVGNNLSLSLVSSSGTTVRTYSVYLLGDTDGDGEITDNDVAGWISVLFSGDTLSTYLDIDGDGVYTLNDFVLLLRRKNGGEN